MGLKFPKRLKPAWRIVHDNPIEAYEGDDKVGDSNTVW